MADGRCFAPCGWQPGARFGTRSGQGPLDAVRHRPLLHTDRGALQPRRTPSSPALTLPHQMGRLLSPTFLKWRPGHSAFSRASRAASPD
eukprot:scaffold14632_cov119-Isochrysis_galbana.AAC.1